MNNQNSILKFDDIYIALKQAIQQGDINTLETLLAQNTNIDINHQEKESAQNLLMLAAESGYFKAVQLLIDQGANLHQANKAGHTVLTLAAQRGHIEVVRCLLAYGADIYFHDDGGYTPLMLAAESGYIEVVRCLLLAHNSDSDFDTYINDVNYYHDTPLTLAAANGHFAVVQCLVEYGANIHHSNNNDDNALIVAAQGGYIKIVRYLIVEHKVNPNYTNYFKDTPLTLAAQSGRIEVVQYLIENHKANPNRTNNHNNTPLTLAAQSGRIEVVRYLIENQVDPDHANHNNDTPLTLAAQGGYLEIVQLLLKQGASADYQTLLKTLRNPTSGNLLAASLIVYVQYQYKSTIENLISISATTTHTIQEHLLHIIHYQQIIQNWTAVLADEKIAISEHLINFFALLPPKIGRALALFLIGYRIEQKNVLLSHTLPTELREDDIAYSVLTSLLSEIKHYYVKNNEYFVKTNPRFAVAQHHLMTTACLENLKEPRVTITNDLSRIGKALRAHVSPQKNEQKISSLFSNQLKTLLFSLGNPAQEKAVAEEIMSRTFKTV